MEQTRYNWTWSTKRKHGGLNSVNLNPSNSYDDSWEEQAFAEDAAGSLGGCIWPPRSYSCSFCRREFRSAQALGGHMNVHRRDRARLKQSSSNDQILPPTPHDQLNLHPQNNPYNVSLATTAFQYPSHQISTSSPNPSSDPPITNSSSSSPNSRFSTTPTTQENCCEKTLFPTFSSSNYVEEQQNNSSPRSSPLALDRPCDHHRHLDLRREGNQKSSSRNIVESTGCRAKFDCVKTDLSVSLNLVVRRTHPTALSDDEEDDEGKRCKRRRTEISPCSIEELDLELRLGERPKVK